MKEYLKLIIVTLLTWEAKLLLKRTQPKIIAVTGSVGKTSTKDAIYEALKGHVHVRKSEKSFNSEIGVPLSVLGLPNAWSNPFLWIKNLVDGLFLVIHPGNYPSTLVLEMGVDRPGDMAKLTTWIKPDVVVLTRLPDVPVHVEFFDSPEAVIAEKLKLVEALKPDGVLVYNHDDEKIRRATEQVFQKCLGYSRYSRAPFTVSGDKVIYDHGKATGYTFTLAHLEEHVQVTLTSTIGVQNAYIYGAAAAVASLFSIGLSQVVDTLGDYISPPGRMRLIPGIKGTLIIDDTYNSSPIAAEQALRTLKELKGTKRRIAVLGDMMELGQFSIREHERIGKAVVDAADILVAVGVRARGFSKGALEAGMSEKNIFEFDSAEAAGRELQSYIKTGDVLLVKGSQSIRAEKIVLELMAEPSRAGELLVRQDTAWQEL